MWPRGERLAARPVREHGGGRLQLRRVTTRHGEGSGERGGSHGGWGERQRGRGYTELWTARWKTWRRPRLRGVGEPAQD